MNKYEIMFIVKSDMEESTINQTVDTLKKVLTDNGAKMIEEKKLGQKDLAYEIKKYKTGYYFLFIVEAETKAIDEINRIVGINESVLRHLVVKVED